MIADRVKLMTASLLSLWALSSGGCLQPLDVGSASEPLNPQAGPTIVDLQTPEIDLADGTASVATACEATTHQARSILSADCAVCHEAPQNHGNFNSVLDFATLVTALSKTTTDPVTGQFVRLLIPGDAEGSRLYIRMKHDEMPPAGLTPRPSIADFSIVQQWIGSCLDDAGGIKASDDQETGGAQ